MNGVTLSKAIEIIEAEIDHLNQAITDTERQIDQLEDDLDDMYADLHGLKQKHQRLIESFVLRGDIGLDNIEPIVTPEMSEIARRVNAASPLDEWIRANQEFQRAALAQLPERVLAGVGV